MQAKKYKAYLADKSGDLTYFHMSTLTDRQCLRKWHLQRNKDAFYSQLLGSLNWWHFTEAINAQWTLQNRDWNSTKIWQHTPLTRPGVRVCAKGSCQSCSKLCCDTPWKRRNLENTSVPNYQLFGLPLQWRHLISESGKYWRKKNKHSNSVNISDFQKCCPLIIPFSFC